MLVVTSDQLEAGCKPPVPPRKISPRVSQGIIENRRNNDCEAIQAIHGDAVRYFERPAHFGQPKPVTGFHTELDSTG